MTASSPVARDQSALEKPVEEAGSVKVFDFDTVFSQLNAPGVYFKLGLVDPAFI